MNVGKAVRIRGASQDNDGYEQKKPLIDWLIDLLVFYAFIGRVSGI